MPDTIGTAYIQIKPTTEGIQSALEKEMSSAGDAGGKSFSSAFGKIFGTTGAVIGGITAAIGGVSSAIVSATNDVAEYGDNIDKMSQKLGISAEAYQEWDAVMQHSGSSIDGLKTGIKKINEDLATAPSKIEDYYEELYELKDAFAAGKISQEEYRNSSEKLTDSLYGGLGGIGELAKTAGLSINTIEQMAQNSDFALETVISTLQEMPEGAKRAALANDVLGRSAMDLGALFNTSAEETQAMRDRVHELGGVMEDDAVKAAAAFQDQLQDMQTASQSLVRNLAAEFLPGITDVMGGLTDIFAGDSEKGAAEISAGIDNIISEVTKKLPEIMKLGKEIIFALMNSILDNLPDIIKTGMDVVKDLIIGITEMLPELIDTATTLVLEIINTLAETLPEMLPKIIEAILTVVQKIIDNLPTILKSLLGLITAVVDSLLNEGLPIIIAALPDLIMGIVDFIISSSIQFTNALVMIIKALAEALPEIIQQIVDVLPDLIDSIINAILDNLPLFIQAGIDLFIALIEAMPQIIVAIVKAIPQIIIAIVEALIKAWPKIKEAGKDLLIQLMKGLTDIGTKIKDGVKKIWDAMKYSFKEMTDKAVEWGKDLLQNFIDGIKSKISALGDAVKSVADKVKDFLGFSEPDEGPLSNFHTFAPDMIDLFAKGIRENLGTIDSAMQSMTGEIATEMQITSQMSSLPADSGYNSELGSIYDLLSKFLPELVNNSNVSLVIEGDPNGMFRAMIREADAFKKQTGRSAFA